MVPEDADELAVEATAALEELVATTAAWVEASKAEDVERAVGRAANVVVTRGTLEVEELATTADDWTDEATTELIWKETAWADELATEVDCLATEVAKVVEEHFFFVVAEDVSKAELDTIGAELETAKAVVTGATAVLETTSAALVAVAAPATHW